ncbi:MAG: hypothetical protein ACI4CS_10840, partial [Candidatus Weimeria sp.]
VITKVDNAEVKTVYSGKSNTATITIPKHTMYSFKVRSYTKKGSVKKNSAWTEGINYFPATDDIVSRDPKYATFIKRFQNFFGGKDNCSVHGNVLTMRTDYKFINPEKEEIGIKDYTVVNRKSVESDQPEVIIDFAGHTLTGHLDMRCASPLVFTDSVGGGGITDTEEGFIGIGSNKKVTINAGNYTATMKSYITWEGQKLYYYQGFSMSLSSNTSSIEINGGTFCGGIIGVTTGKVVVNNAVFNLDYASNGLSIFSEYNTGAPREYDIVHATLNLINGNAAADKSLDKAAFADKLVKYYSSKPEVNIGDINWVSDNQVTIG